MCLDKVGALMAQKVHDLVIESAGTPGLYLTRSPSEGVMMILANYLVGVCSVMTLFALFGCC